MLKLSNTALVSVLSLVMWNVGRSHAYPVGGSANCKDAIAKDGPSNAGKLSRTCFSSFACVTVENGVPTVSHSGCAWTAAYTAPTGACVRACVYACVRACVRVCLRWWWVWGVW